MSVAVAGAVETKTTAGFSLRNMAHHAAAGARTQNCVLSWVNRSRPEAVGVLGGSISISRQLTAPFFKVLTVTLWAKHFQVTDKVYQS
jgi:hypothetical protein